MNMVLQEDFQSPPDFSPLEKSSVKRAHAMNIKLKDDFSPASDNSSDDRYCPSDKVVSDDNSSPTSVDQSIVANLVFRAIQELGSAVPGLSLSLVLDGTPICELREAIRTLKDDLDLITGGNIYFDQNKRCHNYVYGRDRHCNDSKLDKCFKLA